MIRNAVHMSRDRFEAIYFGYDTLTSGGDVVPEWSSDGTSFTFADGGVTWRVDTATGRKTAVTDDDEPASERWARDADERLRRTFELGSPEPRTYRRAVPGLDTQLVPETPSPDGRHLVSTRDGNIVLRSRYDGRERLWTSDGTPDVHWRFDPHDPAADRLGWASPVTNWSPDGTRLAAYRVDVSGVAPVPKIHYLGDQDQVEFRQRPKAGATLERATLAVLDVHGTPPVEIDLGDTTDCYPVYAGWLPDGSELLVVRMSRDCRQLDVFAADPATGSVRPLFSETGETFLRIHHDVWFGRKAGLWPGPDGTQLVWLSDRDGWLHLYAYDLDGKPLRQLTSGAWPVKTVQRIAGGFVYFTAHHDQARPYDVHLCRVPVDGGEVTRLTDGDGLHRPALSPDAGAFVDTWSTPSQPPVSALRRADGTVLAELSRADTTALDELGWVPPEQFTVTAADGETELWGVMFFPGDFDPARRYPLVEYVYAGPQEEVNTTDWAGGFFTRPARALAQLGYVTVLLDARGTPGRSKAFHDAVYGDWAGARVADHAGAIGQLVERHDFLDADRVGVMGHSWGGYSAFRLLADRPDVYRAAVANSPAFDTYASVLYECYLGLPQQNPDVYAAADALPLAAELQGALMIACGTSDHQTWTDAIKMTEALVRAGKPHEFVILPGQPHWYDATHERYFWGKVEAFFTAELGA